MILEEIKIEKITIKELAAEMIVHLLSGFNELYKSISDLKFQKSANILKMEILIWCMFCEVKALSDIYKKEKIVREVLDKFHEYTYSALLEHKLILKNEFKDFQQLIANRYNYYYSTFSSYAMDSHKFTESLTSKIVDIEKNDPINIIECQTILINHLINRAKFFGSIKKKYKILDK